VEEAGAKRSFAPALVDFNFCSDILGL